MKNKIVCNSLLIALVCGLVCAGWSGAESRTLPSLKVSDNHRFLVTTDNKPFFYLGDTAWELFHRLNREEADRYLENRAAKGFTVIQAVALAELNGTTTPNSNGHLPLIDLDPTRPALKEGPGNDYWDHVDYIVAKANALGLYIGFLPTWGNYWHDNQPLFNPANAEVYGEWLGHRYKDAGIIWILGGDRTVDNEQQRDIIRAMARGLRKGDGGAHLITFHPRGGKSSSLWFQQADWLDFNMGQSSHSPTSLNYAPIEHDYGLEPTKPVLDGEPAYEYPPDAMPEKRPVGALQVRRNAYWAVFAGACGHTYGTHPIWQMYDQGRKPLWDVVTPWHQALELPGAIQLTYLKRLMLSRPFLTRIPDQSVIAGDTQNSVDHLQATRDISGSYAMVYSASSKPFKVRMDKIAGNKVRAWWVNPRDGSTQLIGEFPSTGEREFTSPDKGEMLLDWVLVLDDASKNFLPPIRNF